MSYLLDANVFIEAKNRHYGFDFCPAFWAWLVATEQVDRVFSIDKVADELAAGSDELTTWASEQGRALFRATGAVESAHFGRIAGWVSGQRFQPGAVDTFLKAADFFLIAHALAGGHTIVTHEVFSDGFKRVKIPNVCNGLGLGFMTPYQMLRVENARFVLGGG